MGPVHSNTNSTPWEHTAPAAITVLGTIQTHKQWAQPDTHSLPGAESVHAGEVSCPVTQRHTAAAKTRTQTSRSQVMDHSHDAMMPCMYRVHFSHKGTEGGHCQGACCPQRFFQCHIPLKVSMPVSNLSYLSKLPRGWFPCDWQNA